MGLTDHICNYSHATNSSTALNQNYLALTNTAIIHIALKITHDILLVKAKLNNTGQL